MTEKRYQWYIDGADIWDNQKEERIEDIPTLLNELFKENELLKKELQKIQDSFELSWTQNYIEFDQDKLYIKDNNTEIRLDGTNLFIEVYIPQTDEYYRFNYIVSGRRNIMREFIKDYNSGDDE